MGLFIFAIVLILLGLFVRAFWVELVILWYVFLWIVNLVVGSWLIAVVVKMYDYLINGNVWENFKTTWAYCAVFYTVLNVFYLLIVFDMASMAIDLIRKVFKK
jgi:hypothetical protein